MQFSDVMDFCIIILDLEMGKAPKDHPIPFFDRLVNQCLIRVHYIDFLMCFFLPPCSILDVNIVGDLGSST